MGGVRESAGQITPGSHRPHSWIVPSLSQQALDVAALALGEQGVEGQGRLPGAGRPGDDDQLVAGQRDVDALQIVLGRPLDADLVEHNPTILSQMGDMIPIPHLPSRFPGIACGIRGNSRWGNLGDEPGKMGNGYHVPGLLTGRGDLARMGWDP